MRRRDEDSFEQFFRSMIERTVVSAQRVLNDRAAAEDAAVEALARAHDRWSRLESDPHREAWVLRVAINRAIDELRRRNRRPRDTDTASAVFEDDLLRNLDLVRAVNRLPRRQREAVSLRYLADLSEQTVAASMGVSPGTVKVHLHRGLEALGAGMAALMTKESSDATA